MTLIRSRRFVVIRGIKFDNAEEEPEEWVRHVKTVLTVDRRKVLCLSADEKQVLLVVASAYAKKRSIRHLITVIVTENNIVIKCSTCHIDMLYHHVGGPLPPMTEKLLTMIGSRYGLPTTWRQRLPAPSPEWEELEESR